MNVQNGERLATKQDLADMYQEILPYLGGSADAGFTPVGSIIAIMGVTAPANYLACNGQTVNIADYPELAEYFEEQFGSVNNFGGDGTTTFGIPDLSGEFLRGTGTNSHANQGSGENVGVHQDGTTFPNMYVSSSQKAIGIMRRTQGLDGATVAENKDSEVGFGTYQIKATGTDTNMTTSVCSTFNARPTNTSVLYCIATKNIYLNPSNDYSTEEKVVGTWIDGKPLYQKTWILQSFNRTGTNDLGLSSIADSIIPFNVFVKNGLQTTPLAMMNPDGFTYSAGYFISSDKMVELRLGNDFVATEIVITFQYTKTTD